MATKRKTSTRKGASRSSRAKSTATRKTASGTAAPKSSTITVPRTVVAAKAVNAAQDAVTKAVKDVAKSKPPKITSTPVAVTDPEKPLAPAPRKETAASVAVTKRALVERVAARAGVRKAQARPLVEAMLAELGEALDREEILKLQPLGVMRVSRVKDAGGANVMVCKLRRKKSEKGGKDPLAEAAE